MSARRTVLGCGALAITALAGCGGGLQVETVHDDCGAASCSFPGIDVAATMVDAGEQVGGDWHEWLEPIRRGLRAEGVRRWRSCTGDVTTVTFTGEADASGQLSLKPLALTVARWRDGEVVCTGELGVPIDHPPLPAGALPGPADTLEIVMPEVGASFELDV